MGNLHFKFARVNGVAKVRTKLNVTQLAWSDAWDVWRHPLKGPRECSFSLADMGNCVYRSLSPEALQTIARGIESCRPRLSSGDYDSCRVQFEMLSDPPIQEFAWPDGGVFHCERRPIVPTRVDVKAKNNAVTHTVQLCHLREHPRLWASVARREKEKDDAKRTTVPLTIGNFVAVGMDYDVAEHEIPVAQQRPFWVGRVTAINEPTHELVLHWYHTSAKKRYIDGKYKVWSIGKKIETVPMGAVWAVWDKLTGGHKIPTDIRTVLKRRVANPHDVDDGCGVVDLTKDHWIGCAGEDDSEAEDGNSHKAQGRGYGRQKNKRKGGKKKQKISAKTRKQKSDTEDDDEEEDEDGGDDEWERAQVAYEKARAKFKQKKGRKRRRPSP